MKTNPTLWTFKTTFPIKLFAYSCKEDAALPLNGNSTLYLFGEKVRGFN